MLSLLRQLRGHFRSAAIDRDLQEELRVHQELKTEALQARGVPEREASRQARRAMGNTTLAREDARAVWIAPWLDGVLQDVRYALRALARQPLFAATAGAVLVLGIGLAAALFGLLRAVALEPWPVDDPRSVVKVQARRDSRAVAPSVDEYRFLREHATSFAGLAAHAPIYPVSVRAAGVEERSLRGSWASANFFEVLGVRTTLGGAFVADDDRPGNTRAPVVLAHSAWRAHFGSDPGIVGRAVTVAGKPFTIVGVLDARFDGNGREVDVWMPLSAFSAVRPGDGMTWEPSPGSARCCVAVVGRLKPPADRRAAAEELQVLHERFASARKTAVGRIVLFGTAELDGPGAGRYAVFGALGAAVALVLVLACANVGNLHLARALARRREIATRLAIGASRGRIVRQLVTEGLVLACAAGGCAAVVGVTLPPLLYRALGDPMPPYVLARLDADAGILLFTLAVSVAAAFVFALAPAMHASRHTIPLSMLDRSPGARFHLRAVLLATQLAACTVLLTGAGLITRAISYAFQFDVGFRIEGVDMLSLSFPSGTTARDRAAVTRGVLDALPADEAPVAVAEIAPLNDAPFVLTLALPGRSVHEYDSVLLRPVSSRFFDVLGVPLVSGRMFDSRTTTDAVVNESFARVHFPGADPVGQAVRWVDRRGGVNETYTIVGVVRDTYLTGLERVAPVIFTPTSRGIILTRGGSQAAARVRAALAAYPAVSMSRQPLSDSMRRYLEETRVGAAAAWALGLLGLGLSAVGVAGVFAYAVEERRREIGVRLALGAARAHILRMLAAACGRGMIAGLAVGLFVSVAAAPLMRRYLLGLSPFDPAAYLMTVCLLAAAALAATFVPGLRACRVDPAITLREE